MLKKSVSIIMICAMILCTFSICASAADNYNYKPFLDVGRVEAEALNVRKNADSSSERVAGVKKGDFVYIIDILTNNGKTWYLVKYDSSFGYVDSAYISRFNYKNLLTIYMDGSEYSGANFYVDPSNIPMDIPSRPGYYFAGWAYSPDADTPVFQPGESIVLSQPVIIFPVWKASAICKSDTIKVPYKSDTTIIFHFYNAADGSTIELNDIGSIPVGPGDGAVSITVTGITESLNYNLKLIDKYGKPTGVEGKYTVKVDNSFFGKLTSFFRYIFNGFKWGTSTAEFN